MRGQGVGSARRIAAGALLIWAIPFAARAADWLEVTYQSDPAGAALYEGSRLMGHLPLKLRYQVEKTFRRNKTCISLMPLTARWVSGAQSSVTELTACGQNGMKQQLSFLRPVGFPGAEIDAEFAIEAQRLALQRGEEQQAAWDCFIATLAPRPLPPPITCLSTLSGDSVITTCH